MVIFHCHGIVSSSSGHSCGWARNGKTFQIKTTKNGSKMNLTFLLTHTQIFSYRHLSSMIDLETVSQSLKVIMQEVISLSHGFDSIMWILCFWKKWPVLDRQIFTSFQAFWMSYTLDLKTFLFGFMGWERVVCSYLFGLDLFWVPWIVRYPLMLYFLEACSGSWHLSIVELHLWMIPALHNQCVMETLYGHP